MAGVKSFPRYTFLAMSASLAHTFCHAFRLGNTTDVEIRDLFLRLQEGVSLNPAEKRNAMIGNMRTFVADLGETHPVFPLTRISSARYAWHNLAAIVVCLELSKGPTDVKSLDLQKLYEQNRGFEIEGSTAKKIKKILTYMARSLQSEPPEMNIKWGFVDLYLLVSDLIDNFVLKDRESELGSFYIAFETERREVDDPADLIESDDRDEWDRDLYDYIDAFVREGAKRQNLQIRHDVYMRRLLRFLPDIQPKDTQRGFSRDQRIVIWRNSGGLCKECGRQITLEQTHADHVIPHARGGLTTVDNGQALCAVCNLRKGSAHP